jgi:uncharacterized membrane protein
MIRDFFKSIFGFISIVCIIIMIFCLVNIFMELRRREFTYVYNDSTGYEIKENIVNESKSNCVSCTCK